MSEKGSSQLASKLRRLFKRTSARELPTMGSWQLSDVHFECAADGLR